jgi:undecaprenyl diphosphate synthase
LFFKYISKNHDYEGLYYYAINEHMYLIYDKHTKKSLQKIEKNSSHNSKLTVNVCFNYSGQQDIQFAMQNIAQEIENGVISSSDISPELISDNLSTAGQPDLDLIIRTSGEFRLSNFMLWQASYAEFYVSQANWPEFTKDEYLAAIRNFAQRERRYGGN